MTRHFGQSLFLLLLCCLAGCKRERSESAQQNPSDQFISLMNVGKNYLEQGDATNAVAIYEKARAIVPHDPDVHLNLANAHLASGAAAEAIREADEVLKLDPNSAAAYFVKGSAYLRLANAEEAVKALENSRKIDPGVNATLFQLGLARIGLKQWDAAITAFREGMAMDPNRLHTAPRYLLAQALIRAGREEEAKKELELHQANVEGGASAVDAGTFERSKFTQARVPFRLDQPEKDGIKMRFTDATKETLGVAAQSCSGPVGVIDPNRTGWNSLFLMEQGSFRLLRNSNGMFHPYASAYPARPGASYSRMLVGDLPNDRFDDVIVLGEKGSHVFAFATNGLAKEVSALTSVNAMDGTLMDLDFTGKLDLVAIGASNQVRIYRQFGPLAFSEITSTSGVPASLQNAQAVMIEDWNRDGNMDVIASRNQGSPLLLEKQRGGPLMPREMNWAAGAVFCTGDFNNDLRPDIAVVSDGKISICFNGGERKDITFSGHTNVRQLVAVDYDNDGWLDLWVIGEKIRAWRNAGLAGFREQTVQLGLDKL